jgi:hypothetical protein
VDDERLMAAEYGIQFAPAGEESGYIEAGYHTSFGVCGTGLEEVETTLAGETVQIGYFDKSKTWDFVSFSSSAKGHGGVVALPFYCEAWSEQDFDEALTILDTLVYNEDELTGGIGFYEEDSVLDEQGLTVSAKNVSKSGAELIFRQTDDTATSVLAFGENMNMERKTEDGWEEVPSVLEGRNGSGKETDYINMTGDVTEYQYDWEQVYGELEAGEYRIRIPITIFYGEEESGYERLCAYFLLR